MVQQLLNILIAAAQMVGLGMLAWGCFLIAGATFSGRHAGFIKGGALVLIGAYLAGYGASLR
jgi:hypothetical protein